MFFMVNGKISEYCKTALRLMLRVKCLGSGISQIYRYIVLPRVIRASILFGHGSWVPSPRTQLSALKGMWLDTYSVFKLGGKLSLQATPLIAVFPNPTCRLIGSALMTFTCISINTCCAEILKRNIKIFPTTNVIFFFTINFFQR